MISVAVVEDDKKDSDTISEFLNRYARQKNVGFEISVFGDGLAFLDSFKPSSFDLILLDVQMPDMDGMAVAERLRAVDTLVLIIFITNMGNYAVRGYDVGAVAFIKKPVIYTEFSQKLARALFTIEQRDSDFFFVSGGGSQVRIMVRDLMYVDVMGHISTFHLAGGRIFEARIPLGTLSEQLAPYDFMAISKNCLVNPAYIRRINTQTVELNGCMLDISRLKKKAFLLQFSEWLAKGGRSL